MSKNRRILLSIGLISPLITIPVISISCSQDAKKDLKKIKNLLKTSVEETNRIFSANKASLAFSFEEEEVYQKAIDKARDILKNSSDLIMIESTTNHMEIAKNEMESKIANLSKKSDQELLKLAESYTRFSYPSIENTTLAQADLNKIIKILPKTFEFSQYKAVKNEETNDITFIYRLQKKNTNIRHEKNKFFILTGWKKGMNQINKELEEKTKLDENLTKLKIRFNNEKAYQNVLTNVSINNFENKPNFVVSEYDKNLYNFELSNLVKVSDNEYKIDILLYSNTDKKISKKITKTIDKERYAHPSSINPHNLTQEKQKEFLVAQLKNVLVYPYYSKDKTFIEKGDYAKLTNKSYWLTTKNHQLQYVFKDIKEENDIKKITIEVSFADWSKSPMISYDVQFDLNKLGIEELNNIRKQKGQEPLEDIQAPTNTIENKQYKQIKLVDFKETSSDEYLTSDNGFKRIHDKALKNLKSKELVLINNEIKEKILKDGEKFIAAQHFEFNKNTYQIDSELFFYNYTQTFIDTQNVLIFSKPIIENKKIKSIKVSLGSLTDVLNKDYARISSTRVKINDEKTAEEDIKRLQLTEEIKARGFDKKLKYNGSFTKENFDLKNLIYDEISIPEGFEIIKPTKFEVKTKKSKTKISVIVRYKKNNVESFAFVTVFEVN
ncbi:variable surface lipoprotein [Mycoplasma sp. 125]|uniref:variable surface lipoprotein n=1 Tax=Mycoplasma sp. 125 TaxID=3447505 RepID=UPI003F659256